MPAQLAVLCWSGARVSCRRLDPDVRDMRRTFWWLMYTAVAVNMVATIVQEGISHAEALARQG